MRRIIIETVDKDKMRYDTLGDWFYDTAGNLIIQVAAMESIENAPADVLDDDGFLIALHELIEAKLCYNRNISQKAVDEFDLAFIGSGEPGDDPASPYRREHRFSCVIEHLVAHELNLTGYGRVE